MTDRDEWGRERSVDVDAGTIRYREVGTGPVLLFVHGLLVNGTLWRDVVPPLAGRFRCIVPDLPLGGHAVPMHPQADLTPSGVARIVVDLMVALDLHEVTLVGNDTGGAICQIVVTEHPERIGGLVLTNCDAYQAFFPLLLRPFAWGAATFGERFTSAIGWALRHRPAQRLLLRLVARRRMDEATLDAYFSAFTGNAGVRRDVARFLPTVSSRYTLEAAKRFSAFTHPVLIVWGTADFIFPAKLAHRLQHDFANARLKFIAGSRAFVPEDRPEELASAITRFMDGR